MIYAGIYGINNRLTLPDAADFNLFKAGGTRIKHIQRLPADFSSACKAAAESAFIKEHLPAAILDRLPQIHFFTARKEGAGKMHLEERAYSVLIASAAENFNAGLSSLLPCAQYSPALTVSSISAAKAGVC